MVVVDDDETETEDEEEVKVKLETSDSLLDKYTSKQLPEFWYVIVGLLATAKGYYMEHRVMGMYMCMD